MRAPEGLLQVEWTRQGLQLDHSPAILRADGARVKGYSTAIILSKRSRVRSPLS